MPVHFHALLIERGNVKRPVTRPTQDKLSLAINAWLKAGGRAVADIHRCTKLTCERKV